MLTPSACIEANVGDIAKVVLMPGDPLRAKYVAETYLEQPVCFNTIRGMLGYTGTYKNKKISVMGSGMGIPSMCLYAHELYGFFEVDSIIRIGSAGGILDDVKLRDVVVAMSASTNSDFAAQYRFPGHLAPAASFELLSCALDSAKECNFDVRVGSVFTTDQFYNANDGALPACKAMGMLVVEMETAGLYLEAMHMRKKALAILTVSDHVFTHEGLSALERQETFDDMMKIALETAWKSLA